MDRLKSLKRSESRRQVQSSTGTPFPSDSETMLLLPESIQGNVAYKFSAHFVDFCSVGLAITQRAGLREIYELIRAQLDSIRGRGRECRSLSLLR